MTGQASGHIGTRILRARLSAGMTQTRLAAAMSVRERTVARWEAGTSKPDVGNLFKLAKLLGQTPAELQEPNGEPQAA